MNLNGRDKKIPRPCFDLNMDKLLDDKLIEVELRKEEPDCDSYVRLLEDGARDSLHFVKYETQGNYWTFHKKIVITLYYYYYYFKAP